MSASSSYGTLINSLNLFLDSSNTNFEGDNMTVHLNQPLQLQSGQVFKLVLSEFSIYNPIYCINENNNKIRVKTQIVGNPPVFANLEIPIQNYGTLGDIADAVSTLLNNYFSTLVSVASTSGNTTPDNLYTSTTTGTGIFSTKFNFVSNHGLDEIDIQLMGELSDSYLVLGGDRLDSDTGTSLEVTIQNTSIAIAGRYPMMKTTTPFIYVRTSLPNTNMSSSSLDSAIHQSNTHLANSSILGKIPMDFDWISFVNQGPHDEFFCYLQQKHISSFNLRLTDHRGRSLGRFPGSKSKTSAGTGDAQSITGNLNFTATIRVDTIQHTPPKTLQTPGIQYRDQFRESSQLKILSSERECNR